VPGEGPLWKTVSRCGWDRYYECDNLDKSKGILKATIAARAWIDVYMSSDARKVNYRLTEKGIDLAPVLLELLIWGARQRRDPGLLAP